MKLRALKREPVLFLRRWHEWDPIHRSPHTLALLMTAGDYIVKIRADVQGKDVDCNAKNSEVGVGLPVGLMQVGCG